MRLPAIGRQATKRVGRAGIRGGEPEPMRDRGVLVRETGEAGPSGEFGAAGRETSAAVSLLGLGVV